MNIILGATGQIGSGVIQELRKHEEPLMGVTRRKVGYSGMDSISVRQADLLDSSGLKKAFQGGHTVFLLTPENPGASDPVGDAERVIKNCREAILESGIKKIVGLSSIGAQHLSGTGNLVISNMLENAFSDLSVDQVFVRPAYFFSNWLGFVKTARETGMLHTFFPTDLKIHMIAPSNVAEFNARVIMNENYKERIYEITGPETYSPSEVADIMGKFWRKEVRVEQIPPELWFDTLHQAGFSEKVAIGLIEMTEAVIDGRAQPQKEERERVVLPMTLHEYLGSQL